MRLQLRQRRFHHADGARNDAAARGDDRVGLLPLQHRLGDFRRVSEVADARIEHSDARIGKAVGQFAL